MQRVAIFGVGDLAKQLDYYLEYSASYQVDYFVVNKKYFSHSKFLGKEVIVFEEEVDRISPDVYRFLLGIGYKRLRARRETYDMLKERGYSFINYVHPSAQILGKVVGEGNIILPNVTVEPFSEIGDNNVIWTNNLICHDSKVGSHNFIASGSIIGGYSRVEEGNFIGFNSTIRDHVTINREVLIGAKSLVLHDPEDYSVYQGTPARKVKEHHEEGICIK